MTESKKVVAVYRSKPDILTPEDDKFDWVTVNSLLSSRTILNFVQVGCLPWLTVCAPKGVPRALTNLYGQGLYQYKFYNGRTYCLQKCVIL